MGRVDESSRFGLAHRDVGVGQGSAPCGADLRSPEHVMPTCLVPRPCHIITIRWHRLSPESGLSQVCPWGPDWGYSSRRSLQDVDDGGRPWPARSAGPKFDQPDSRPDYRPDSWPKKGAPSCDDTLCPWPQPWLRSRLTCLWHRLSPVSELWVGCLGGSSRGSLQDVDYGGRPWPALSLFAFVRHRATARPPGPEGPLAQTVALRRHG